MRAVFSELHSEVYDVLVDGDMAAARWTVGGIQTGEFLGLPATGKSFVMTGIVMDKREGDRIVEEWNSYDMTGALQQLGLMPDQAQMAKMTSQRANR